MSPVNMSQVIRCVACPVSERPIIKNVQNNLHALQQEVGGLIEIVPMNQAGRFVVICDEEGRLTNKAINKSLRCIAQPYPFVGDCLITAQNELGEFDSLTEDEADYILSNLTAFYDAVDNIRSFKSIVEKRF